MYYKHEQVRQVAGRQNRPVYPSRATVETDHRDARAYLTSRDLSPELATLAGWYPSRHAGDSALRIVIPAPWSDGTPYWQARSIVDAPSIPRYLSPAAGRGDGVVVVYPRVLAPDTLYVIAEGPMDALALAGAGCVGIALMGNRPPASVWKRIATLVRGHQVVVLPDADAVHAAGAWASALARFGVTSQLALVHEKDFCALTLEARRGMVTTWHEQNEN